MILGKDNIERMLEMSEKFGLLAVCGALALAVQAAPVKVEVAHPERYGCGETAVFAVTLGNEKGVPTNGLVTAVLSNYGTKVVSSNVFDLARGPSFSVSGTLDEPGFLLLTLSGKAVDRNWGGGTFVTSVAYEPEKVRTGAPKPADFDAYWDGELARLEREVPLDVRLEPCEKYSNEKRVLSRVSFATFRGRRVWGFLSEPRDRSRGPFPTRVTCPVRVVAGLSDSVCPPASCTTAYNACPSKDKRLVLVPNMTHAVFGDQYAHWNAWSRTGGTPSRAKGLPCERRKTK